MVRQRTIQYCEESREDDQGVEEHKMHEGRKSEEDVRVRLFRAIFLVAQFRPATCALHIHHGGP
jgi:hypothetical protein